MMNLIRTEWHLYPQHGFSSRLHSVNGEQLIRTLHAISAGSQRNRVLRISIGKARAAGVIYANVGRFRIR
ncbi:MAG: hypothetical protein KDE01_21450, partial [Caldilineaceae bacterium]|nr:hypothetical protein [Caldilineaceae bacterium]